jgi:TetR/AcrR family transcriptional regulator, tetracycline repressor protein
MPVKREPETAESRPRRRGRPPVISRQQVLATALAIVDERGLEGLTMRRLGAELGVDPMAIYHHVADKAALFDGIVGQVFSEVEIPAAGGHWATDLRAVMNAARETFLEHPNVVGLLGTRPAITEPAFDLMEAITSLLLDAGFDELLAADGFDCAGRLVIGHVLAQGGRPPGGDVDGGEEQHREAQRSLAPYRYPALAAVERAGVRHDPDRLFELAVDGLILSLQRRLSA